LSEENQSNQEQPSPVSYRMLTPLIRIRIDTTEKLHYDINNNIRIIVNDNQVFQNFNVHIIGQNRMELFSGVSAMVFNYNPLLVIQFPYVDDFPEQAYAILNVFLKALALFKTTSNTKLKDGPRIIQTVLSNNSLGIEVLRGSDDVQESHAKPYELKLSEIDQFRDFFNQFLNIFSNVKNKKFLYALDFYSKASKTEDVIEKFIFLSLAFEFLFSKENDELSYRFSNRAALLIGENFQERQKISTVIKNVIYEKRSAIVHGSNMKPPSDDILSYFNEFMRCSLLRFLSLLERGYSKPLSNLDSFLLKQDSGDYSQFIVDCNNIFSNLGKLQFQSIRKKSN